SQYCPFVESRTTSVAYAVAAAPQSPRVKAESASERLWASPRSSAAASAAIVARTRMRMANMVTAEESDAGMPRAIADQHSRTRAQRHLGGTNRGRRRPSRKRRHLSATYQ